MHFFDSHCHLQDLRFATDLDSTIKRAESFGIVGFMCCGTNVSDWENVRHITNKYPTVYKSFGVHPWYSNSLNSDWKSILSYLLEISTAFVGEIGLDFSKKDIPKTIQESVFITQLRLAKKYQRPVSIHCVKAWGRMIEILRKESPFAFGGLIHSWSGSPQMLSEFERLGFYISFSGAVTYDKNKKIKESVKIVSENKMLLETDCPDQLVQSSKNRKIGEPADLINIAKRIAELRKSSIDVVSKVTFNNALNFLGKYQ